MPPDSSQYFYQGLLLYALLAMLYAGYTYLVDARLPDDDPQKRKYHPIRILLAPVAFPFFLLYSILAFMMNALFFGLSLFVFAIGLAFVTILSVARNPVRLRMPRKTRPVYQE